MSQNRVRDQVLYPKSPLASPFKFNMEEFGVVESCWKFEALTTTELITVLRPTPQVCPTSRSQSRA